MCVRCADRVLNPELQPCLLCGLASVIRGWLNYWLVGTARLLSLISDCYFQPDSCFAYLCGYAEAISTIRSNIVAQVPQCGYVSLGTSRCFCTEELLYSGSHWLVLLHVAPLMPHLLPLCCDSKAWIRSRREEGQDLGNNSPTMMSKWVPEENIKGLCAPVTVFSVCICVLSSL